MKIFFSIFFSAAVFFGCFSLAAKADDQKNIRYVFLFIADGFGENHRKLLKNEAGSPAMDQFPIVKRTGTLNCSGKITDSAASGTAIACGVKTYNGAIGVDENRMPVKSIAKELKEHGFKVGIISTSSINDATPAAHYSNTFSRAEYTVIMHDLCHSGFDFFGASHFYFDSRHAPKEAEYLALAAQKYKVTEGSRWDKLDKNDKNFVISKMTRDFPGAVRNSPSLADFTAKAIELLDNEKGFFLMVEEGYTDHYSHCNDAGGMIRAAMDFDKAVGKALEFLKKHPDETLIIVTSDHNTGGLYFLENYTPGEANLLNQYVDNNVMHGKVLELYQKQADFDRYEYFLVNSLGLGRITPRERVKLNCYFAHFVHKMRKKYKKTDRYDVPAEPEKVDGMNSANPLVTGAMRLRDSRSGIAWKSFSHTEEKVLTSVKGAGEENFDRDDLENSSIAQIIRRIVLKND